MSKQILALEKIDQLFTIESLREYLEKHKSIKLIVKCDMFCGSNSNLSIADDYLFSLFLGESIYPFCSSISCAVNLSSIEFDLSVGNACELGLILLRFSEVSYSEGKDDSDETIFDSFHELKMDFQNQLFDSNKPRVIFHELADSYMANLVAGNCDLSLSENDLRSLYKDYPEEEFGFWHSFLSPYLNYDLYSSPWAWIIPYDANKNEEPHNIEPLLLSYGGMSENFIMEEADNLVFNSLPSIVLSQSVMMKFPRMGFNIAQKCAYSILKKNNTSLPSIDSGFYSNSNPKVNHFRDVKTHQILLSEDGSLMIVRDDLAQYIFFVDHYGYSSATEISLKNIDVSVEQDYQNAFDIIADRLSYLAGNHIDISCPWNKLDDELFEQLCYDLITYSSNFDLDTRQKMGKSRSRDGGRDIEVYTRSRFNQPKSKWIVQCKLLQRSSTLAGSKVQVSDVIDQYGAEGFWIMTNGVIDATLHDKLDGIARNRKIGIEKWDYLKIERILAKPKYQNIRKRYFGG